VCELTKKYIFLGDAINRASTDHRHKTHIVQMRFIASPQGRFIASPQGRFVASPQGRFIASPQGRFVAPNHIRIGR
jgi:hypothetical protein